MRIDAPAPSGLVLALAATLAAGSPQGRGRDGVAPDLVFRAPGDVRSLAFSDDGRLLAGAGDQGVSVWELEAPRRSRRLVRPHPHPWNLAFGPSGLLLLASHGEMEIWDPWGDARRRALHCPHSRSAAFSADGSRLAAGCDLEATTSDVFARVWSAESGEEVVTVPVGSDHLTDLALSADGRRLVTVGVPPEGETGSVVKLWDLPSGSLGGTLQGRFKSAYSAALSPDGQSLALVAEPAGPDGGKAPAERAISVWRSNPFRESGVWPDAGSTSLVRYRPDGTLLAWDGRTGRLRIWEAGRDRRKSVPVGAAYSGTPWDAALSRDGRWLAQSHDATVRVWNVARLGER